MEAKIQILSPSLRALHKQFFKTLILQVVTPTITLFSPVIFIIYLPLFDTDWDIPTGIFLCAFTLYPAMDALIVLYVVQDYRKAAKCMSAYQRLFVEMFSFRLAQKDDHVLHSHNAGYIFFTTNRPLKASNELLVVLLAVYTGLYSTTISLLAVQYIYRYFAVFDQPRLKYFNGWYFILWLLYGTWFGFEWGVGLYKFNEVDDYSREYMRQEMRDVYGHDIPDVPCVIHVVYITTPTIVLFSPIVFVITVPYLDLEISVPTGVFLSGFTLYPALDAFILILATSFIAYSHYVGIVATTMYHSSIMFHFFLAFNRWCAVFFPLYYKRIFTNFFTLNVTIIIWIIAVIKCTVSYGVVGCYFQYYESFWTFSSLSSEFCDSVNWYTDFIPNNSFGILIVTINLMSAYRVGRNRKSLNEGDQMAKQQRQREIYFIKQTFFQGTSVFAGLVTYYLLAPLFVNEVILFVLSNVWAFMQAAEGYHYDPVRRETFGYCSPTTLDWHLIFGSYMVFLRC
ncbi:hypothetical protein B9Z55_017454 [Caenorhabditis nigoni]|nr:hypothetical protein B9Z55_017454 [Caenorhabditis nigoni]